jgi:hypothetical protein
MFRELVLIYSGTEYRIKPTMDLIRRLELAGFSAFDMARRVHNRDQSFAIFSGFVAEVLRYAGANVTDADIYAQLNRGSDLAGLIDQVASIVSAILPPSPVPVDTAGGGAAAGKPKRAPRSASGSRQQRSS